MKSAPLPPELRFLLLSPQTPFIHRDLSWLQFNRRVLAEAKDPKNPLLERLKFLSITSSNLDEFFTIRFASLLRSIQKHTRNRNEEAAFQLIRIRAAVLQTVSFFYREQEQILESLKEELTQVGIQLVLESHKDEKLYFLGKSLFDQQLLPHLENPDHFSLPQLQTLKNLQLAVLFSKDLWFKIPKTLPLVFTVQDKTTSTLYCFFLDTLLMEHLHSILHKGAAPELIRLTRDGDIDVDFEDEDPESVPDIVRSKINGRDQGRPVRLQSSAPFTTHGAKSLASSLKIAPDQVFPITPTTCLHGLWSMINQLPKEMRKNPVLFYPPLRSLLLKPFLDNRVSPTWTFDSLKKRDYLLHHPYDSFDNFVNWIQISCNDPQVTRIELTIYRMDRLSPLIEALKYAALHKTVRIIIEPRARFDELNNLKLADELIKSGVQVTFGLGKLKLHAKVALITREEEGFIKLYTHLSTGNYNSVTARQYTDLAVLTSHSKIGEDARHLFDSIFNGRLPTALKVLVPAPGRLYQKILSHIRNEIQAARSGLPAKIVAKVNALVDPELITHLYHASSAGVQIDLIVRGACSLVPGVKGLSENIKVISVIDRFLEHSRIYYFKSSKTLYLSSADWMQRNFFSRFEIAFPILDPEVYRYIEEVIIPTYVQDTAKAWELTPLGTWKRRAQLEGTPLLRSQFSFEKRKHGSRMGP